jgi:ketosteroid isomerase-like protein
MTDTATIIHEIETAYAAYAGAFNQGDIATVVRYIAPPYVMTIGNRDVMTAPTDEAVRHQFDGALAGMKGRGWVRSDFKVVQIWPLSDNHALLMTDIVRYKADASVLEKGRYIYQVRRGGQSWQITGVTDVEPPYTGPGEHSRT